jgi:hypothetical protein
MFSPAPLRFPYKVNARGGGHVSPSVAYISVWAVENILIKFHVADFQ